MAVSRNYTASERQKQVQFQQKQAQQQAQQQAAQQRMQMEQAKKVYTGSTDPMKDRNAFQQPAAQQQKTGYNGLAGVSANTAARMGAAQNPYSPSAAVQNAQNAMQQLQAQKPQGYENKYGAQLDNILNQIQNPQQFKYSFDGDELFKYYADLYTQQGRQASMDTMGQAAALTGGYGNSYAQSAAGQQYQQYLLGLYDRGMDLRDRAYQQYRDEQGDLKDQYSMLADRDQTMYGQYRDAVGDWQNDRGYYTDQYNREADRDYERYQDDRDYWTGLAEVENKDYRDEQERQEAIREYEQDWALKRRDQELNENELAWRMKTDQRDYERGVLESDRGYNRDVYTDDRDYNRAVLESDRGYNRDVYTDDRDYNRGVLESDRAYNRDVIESDRAFEEDVRRYGLDYALKQRGMDLEENELSWRQSTDQRDYDRSVMESDRNFEEDVRRYGLDYALKERGINLEENELSWRQSTDNRDYNRGVLESDRAYQEQQRQANLDEAYRRDTLAEQQRQANLDEAYRRDTLDWNKSTDQRDYNRNVLENDRNYNEQVRQANLDEAYRRDTLSEQQRQANLDEAYRQATLDWNKSTDQRDYNRNVLENDRNYNRSVLENDRDYNERVRGTDLDEAYRRDTLSEQQRQANLDEAYRRDTLTEQQRQANLDEAYRRDNLAWNQATNQRDYDRSVYENDRNYNRDVLENDRAFNEQVRQFDSELNERMRQFNENLNWDKMSNDQKYAAQYAMDLLSQGEMPSTAMLNAAEITQEDAQKYINIWNRQQALLAGGPGGPGGPGGGTETPEESYLEASQRVLRYTPGTTTIGELNGTNDTRTLNDMRENAVIDTARPGTLTSAAYNDLQTGVAKKKNSAREYAEKKANERASKLPEVIRGANATTLDELLLKKLKNSKK